MAKYFRTRPKKNSISLGEAIDQALKSNGLLDGVNQVKIATYWDKLMGPMVVQATRELTFYQGKLFIKVNSAPLCHELMMSKEKIKTNLNHEFDEPVIFEVIVRHGA